jgi:D-amino-acid oxidase
MATVKVSIAGAGVAGLTCGVVLAERGHDVTIVASEIGVTSRAAAAIWFPYDCEPAESVARWARVTYDRLIELAHLPESGVSLVPFRCLDIPVPDWIVALGDLPLMETPKYLDYLQRRFRGELRLGTTLRSLDELPGEVVVNCTGVGARTLAADDEVEPHRGQVLVTDRIDLPAALVHETSLAYAIPRNADCILGGTNDVSDELRPRPEDTAKIMEICREYLGVTGRIREVKVGLRPYRRSGVRLEREGRVIHNYGHGGSGFTVSWGCAEDVASRADALQ